jgi:hypothetical protein
LGIPLISLEGKVAWFFCMANKMGNLETVISIKEVKKILGQENKKYSNEQIEKLVQDMATIAKLYIRSVQSVY